METFFICIIVAVIVILFIVIIREDNTKWDILFGALAIGVFVSFIIGISHLQKIRISEEAINNYIKGKITKEIQSIKYENNIPVDTTYIYKEINE